MAKIGIVGVVAVAGVVLSLASPVPAQIQVDLTGGRVAKFFDAGGTSMDRAVVRFARDPAITAPLANPLCPASDALRFQDDNQNVVVLLPCANWSVAGTGYRYFDPAAAATGVKLIKLKPGLLVMKAKGANYGPSALAGPTTFIEAELSIGFTDYCGRFQSPTSLVRSNLANKVIFKGPSIACVVPTPTATPTTAATATPTPLPPHCSDSVKNADESDVDCGGAQCLRCLSGKTCNVNADCLSSSCVLGHCT